MTDAAKTIGLGLVVIAAFVAPTVACGALGYALWGDMGVMLSLTPVCMFGVGLAAYQIGDDIRHPVGNFVSEEGIVTLEVELAPEPPEAGLKPSV